MELLSQCHNYSKSVLGLNGLLAFVSIIVFIHNLNSPTLLVASLVVILADTIQNLLAVDKLHQCRFNLLNQHQLVDKRDRSDWLLIFERKKLNDSRMRATFLIACVLVDCKARHFFRLMMHISV